MPVMTKQGSVMWGCLPNGLSPHKPHCKFQLNQGKTHQKRSLSDGLHLKKSQAETAQTQPLSMPLKDICPQRVTWEFLRLD